MMIQILALAVVAALSGAGAAQPQEPKAPQVIADYLKAPYPEKDDMVEARRQRLDILSRLKTMPEEAVDAIGQALAQVKDSRRRVELVEALGRHVQTKKAAALLCELLKDPDEKVRWYAIHDLRILAARTSRIGGQRKELYPDSRSREEKERTARQAMRDHLPPDTSRTVEPVDEHARPPVEFAPKIEGLVPYLVAAANDEVEENRVCALFALADTRDPLAVAELRSRLKDPSESVRFHAACFLTEYQDASGLPEMQAALARLRRIDPAEDLRRDFELYSQAEMLLASFERITGKSFGPIPMNPILSSDSRQIPELKKGYKALLDTWAQWWAWQPPGNP